MTGELRGRDAELRQVYRFLRTAEVGTAAVLHVEGGWGSGRTRLLRAAADAAAASGFHVVADWSAATEPSILQTVSASAGPVLVALDDLHQADPTTVRNLRTALWRLRDRPIAWALSRRRRAGGAAVEQLFGETCPAADLIDLQPLPTKVVALLLADHTNSPLAGRPALLRAIGGNPLMAVELALGTPAAAPDQSPGEPPARVQACVRRCMADLGVHCRQLVEVGAVLGIRFLPGDVAKLLRRPVAELLAPAQEAIAADVLICDGDWLSFRQPLFWQCVRASLPAAARVAVEHQAAVERLDLAVDVVDEGTERKDLPPSVPSPPLRVGRPEPTAGPSGWEDLSDIERMVASLVSQGLTNQQIASLVFRSPHTVNYHLRRIFRKLDIRSRVELARLTLLHYSASEADEGALDVAG
ncbi:LuxR C-terminal-related transcriptional regulator [Verrucosispora sp. WMMA2044]|uniref:helix-turn-helix transcriptional regulator n=1 Tax=Verrucosispora sp. WMMA2044 TaxID=3016419 RepID=UPI00248C4009|nr:LuxR C-terminal-related transcriptional regulator [Verrucosispora sp. WMMA2044]WBB50422.1 LuxR C-terminal-related transcriptional regulator [Verrucosispora sp. WMMA2044]